MCLTVARLDTNVPRMDSTPQARIAEAVRELMETQGVSQLALSEATGIPRATLIRRLNGHASFTVAELADVAAQLGVRPSQLLQDAEAVA